MTTSSLEEPPWRRVPKRPLPTPEDRPLHYRRGNL